MVVDYKTDRVATDAALDTRAESYRLQLAAYAAAIEAATGERVARGVLVFVGARDPIEAVERAFGRSELGVEAVPALVTDLR